MSYEFDQRAEEETKPWKIIHALSEVVDCLERARESMTDKEGLDDAASEISEVLDKATDEMGIVLVKLADPIWEVLPRYVRKACLDADVGFENGMLVPDHLAPDALKALKSGTLNVGVEQGETEK